MPNNKKVFGFTYSISNITVLFTYNQISDIASQVSIRHYAQKKTKIRETSTVEAMMNERMATAKCVRIHSSTMLALLVGPLINVIKIKNCNYRVCHMPVETNYPLFQLKNTVDLITILVVKFNLSISCKKTQVCKSNMGKTRTFFVFYLPTREYLPAIIRHRTIHVTAINWIKSLIHKNSLIKWEKTKIILSILLFSNYRNNVIFCWS